MNNRFLANRTRVEYWPHPYTWKLEDAVKRLRKQGEKLINLKISNNAVPLPDHVYEELERHMSQYEHSGLAESGSLGLRQAVSEKLQVESKIQAHPESEVLITSGAKEAIFLAIQTTINPGDEVIQTKPGYTYHGSIELSGGRPIYVSLKEENGFDPDPAEVERSISSRTKMIVVCNPNNPTGTVWKKPDLEAIADTAKKHDLVILSDESLEKYVYDGRVHCSIASLPGAEDRTITVQSMSKGHAMPYLRVGYAAGNETLIKQMKKIHRWIMISQSEVTQKIAEIILRGSQRWVDEMIRGYEKKRDIFVSGWSRISGVSCIRPQGCPYTLPNVSEFGLSSMDLAEYLVRETKVLTNPGASYLAEGHLRTSFGWDEGVLYEAIDRVEQALGRLD